MFELKINGSRQLGTAIALGAGVKYKNVVINAAGIRNEDDDIILYVDISPADEVIANELLKILEKEGNFTCDPMTKKIIN